MTERAAAFFIDIPSTFCHNQINDYVTKACGIMLKRWLSLVLAMVLLFTAAVPAASAAVVTPEAAMEMIPQLQAKFNEMTSGEKSLLEQELAGYGIDLDSISWLSSELMNDANAPSATAEPSKAPAQNSWERSHELEANTTEEYSIFHAEFSLFRILDVDSSNSAVATGSMRANRESYSLEELSAPSSSNPSCSLYYSVHAHSAGTATITYRFARDLIGLTVYNDGSHEFFAQDTNEYTLTVHVKVKEDLQPPEVFVSINTSTVTLKPQKYWQPYVADALLLLISAPAKILSGGVKGIKSIFSSSKELHSSFLDLKLDATSYAKQGANIPLGLIDILKSIEKESYSPNPITVTLDVTNPNTTKSIDYQFTLTSDKMKQLSISSESSNSEDSSAYQENGTHVLAPGERQTIRFNYMPEYSYNEKDYETSIDWDFSYCEHTGGAFSKADGFNGSYPIAVDSQLGAREDYRKMERFASDVMTRILESIEFIKENWPVVQAAAKDALNQFVNAADAAIQQGMEHLEQFGNAADAAIQQGMEHLEQFGNAADAAVQQGMEHLDQFGNAADAAIQQGMEHLDQFGNAADTAIQQGMEHLNQFGDAVNQEADMRIDQFTQNWSEFAETANQKIDEFVDLASKTASNAIDKAVSKMDVVNTSAQNHLDSLNQSLENASDLINSKLDQLAE